MKELESAMREITMDGLTWGASKLVPVGYGISKLQVNLVVEDEKVSVDDLQASIEGIEEHVQSTDVVSQFPTYLTLLPDLKLILNDRLPCKSFDFVIAGRRPETGSLRSVNVHMCALFNGQSNGIGMD